MAPLVRTIVDPSKKTRWIVVLMDCHTTIKIDMHQVLTLCEMPASREDVRISPWVHVNWNPVTMMCTIVISGRMSVIQAKDGVASLRIPRRRKVLPRRRA